MYMYMCRVFMGRALRKLNIATPAGVKQAFKINHKTVHTADWHREALKGLTYICTDTVYKFLTDNQGQGERPDECIDKC